MRESSCWHFKDLFLLAKTIGYFLRAELELSGTGIFSNPLNDKLLSYMLAIFLRICIYSSKRISSFFRCKISTFSSLRRCQYLPSARAISWLIIDGVSELERHSSRVYGVAFIHPSVILKHFFSKISCISLYRYLSLKKTNWFIFLVFNLVVNIILLHR